MTSEKPKAYVVRMSVKGMDVKIDADEIGIIIQGIKSGQPIRVRQGIINPSFYVGIVEDVERVSNYLQELNRAIENNRNYEKYRIGTEQKLPEFEKLGDVFEGLQLPSGNKQLTR